jgi:hypothetical protein
LVTFFRTVGTMISHGSTAGASYSWSIRPNNNLGTVPTQNQV